MAKPKVFELSQAGKAWRKVALLEQGLKVDWAIWPNLVESYLRGDYEAVEAWFCEQESVGEKVSP